jgi:hypothetical protein
VDIAGSGTFQSQRIAKRTCDFSSWATVVASMVCAPFSHESVNLNGIFNGTLAHSITTTSSAPMAIMALRSQY